MTFTIAPATTAEQLYTFTQSQEITGLTGTIGHLRAQFEDNTNSFYTSWTENNPRLHTEAFQNEFSEVIGVLRKSFLSDRKALSDYCHDHSEASISGMYSDANEHNYGFRLDTEKHTYMLRLNPDRGYYNIYCYCYRRDSLERHMKDAARGIRFIDPDYNTLFTIPDGGKIAITSPEGITRETVCRYIDPYHLETGTGRTDLLHICQFAERMKMYGYTVTPVRNTERNRETERDTNLENTTNNKARTNVPSRTKQTAR